MRKRIDSKKWKVIVCDAKFMEDTFDSGRRDRRKSEVLFKMMIKRQIRTPHVTTKRTMKNLRRTKKLRQALSYTREPNRSKKRLKCHDQNEQIVTSRLKKCQPQLKTLRLRML